MFFTCFNMGVFGNSGNLNALSSLPSSYLPQAFYDLPLVSNPQHSIYSNLALDNFSIPNHYLNPVKPAPLNTAISNNQNIIKLFDKPLVPSNDIGNLPTLPHARWPRASLDALDANLWSNPFYSTSLLPDLYNPYYNLPTLSPAKWPRALTPIRYQELYNSSSRPAQWSRPTTVFRAPSPDNNKKQPIVVNNQIVYNIHLPFGLNSIVMPQTSQAPSIYDNPSKFITSGLLGNKPPPIVTNNQNNHLNF